MVTLQMSGKYFRKDRGNRIPVTWGSASVIAEAHMGSRGDSLQAGNRVRVGPATTRRHRNPRHKALTLLQHVVIVSGHTERMDGEWMGLLAYDER